MEKKLVLLMPALLLLSSCCNAQAKKDNGQLNFSIGPSFPSGHYASKDFQSDKAGIATVGGLASFSYTHVFKKKIGIVASLLGQINPLDKRAIEKSFDQLEMNSFTMAWGTGIGEPTMPPSNGATYPKWQFKNTSWKLAALLAGGYGEFKTGSQHIALTSKAMLGLVYVSSPKIDGSSMTDTTNVHATQSSKSAFGFGYLVSGGIKIKLNSKIDLISGLEYFGTNNITFKHVVASVSGVKNPSNPATMTAWQSTVTSNGKQKIGSVNLLVGLSLQL